VLSSVHAFAQSAIGPLFFAFIGITFVISLSLLIKRWDELKAEGEMTSVFSREAFFLLNNLLFLAIFVVCFWGVIFPLLTEALGFVGQAVPALSGVFTGQKVTVGPPYYERATGPLFLALLFLMGIAPLSAWGHSTFKTLGRAAWKPFIVSLVSLPLAFFLGVHFWAALLTIWVLAFVTAITLYEFWRASVARSRTHSENLATALWRLAGRNRRRYGGYIIHLGVVLMALGIIGIEMFQKETQGTVPIGGTLQLGNYSIVYDDIRTWDEGAQGVNYTRAEVSLLKDGKLLQKLYPRRDYYYESQQPMTIPALRSTLEGDVYLLLVDWMPMSTDGATFKLFINPLVNWLWLGAFVFIFGTLVAAWPDKDPEVVLSRSRAPRSAAAKAIGD
jgi:cytochrome c-type biogenesis protein CcmF